MLADQWKMVTDNQNLIFPIVNRYIYAGMSDREKEELKDAGMDGLINAAMTYNPEKGAAFSTYAQACISHEILESSIRNQKRQTVSLDEPITGRKKEDREKPSLRSDLIEERKAQFFKEKLEKKDALERTLSIILNCFSPEGRYILLCLMAQKKQKEIAEKVGVSRQRIQQKEIELKERLRRLYERRLSYEQSFQVRLPLESEFLLVIFRKENVPGYTELIEKAQMAQVEVLPRKEIKYDDKKVVIQLTICKEAIDFLSEIFRVDAKSP